MAFPDSDASIARAIYGGEVEPGLAPRIWKELGSPEAVRVWAIEKERLPQPALLAEWCSRHHARCVDPDDGLLYLTSRPWSSRAEQELRQLGALPEEAGLCTSAEQWLPRMRQAIVALRRRRLRLTDPPPSARTEHQLRDLALLEFTRATDWESAVRTWIQTVVARHANKLHNAQWSLVQFLSLLSLNRASLGSTSTLLIAASEQIFQCADLSRLAERFLELLKPLHPILFTAPSPYSRPVRKAMELMSAERSQPLDLARVARAAGVSSAHLARRFRVETGKSFTEQLQQLRVQEAASRLIGSDEGLLEIAADSGFGSIEQFHRVFKRWLGKTPHQYRLAMRRRTHAPGSVNPS